MIPILRFLLIGCLAASAHTAFAQDQNFEGIIKYVSLDPPGAPGDSVIVYYGKHKTRTSRMGTPAEKFGGVTEEITDFEKSPNQTTFYYGARGGDIQIIESKTSGIDSVKTYPDSVIIVLGIPCIKSDVFYAPSEYFGTHRVVRSYWSAASLLYRVPDAAVTSPFHPDNSAGGIPLLHRTTVYSQLFDGSNLTKSTTLIACAVIHKALPDSVFRLP